MASILSAELPVQDCIVLFDPAGSPEAWQEHDRLQSSIFSRHSYLKANQLLDGAQIAQLVSDGVTRRSLVFRIANQSAFVIGALTASAREFSLVANQIFEQYSNVHYVRSEPLVRDPQIESDPRVVIVGKSDDLVRALPNSISDFDLSLKREQRKKIRSHERRFKEDFPQGGISIQRGAEISAHAFHTVIELNRERMRYKGRSSGIDDLLEAQMRQVAIENGLLILLNNGEEVVAGLVIITASDDAYGWTMSYDQKYGKYSPGIIGLHGAIKYLISTGARRFHFLWGDSPYKRQFGAVRDDLASYAILRPGVSRWVIFPLLCSFYKQCLKSEIIRCIKKSVWMVTLYRKIRIEPLQKNN